MFYERTRTKEERIDIFKTLSPFDDEKTEELVKKLDDMNYFTAPASRKYHQNYPGGLFDHSFHVFEILNQINKDKHDNSMWRYLHRFSDLNGWRRNCDRSCFVVGMFHDLCKCDDYIVKYDDDGCAVIEHNPDKLLIGHGDKSVMLINKLDIRLTDEEMACIRYHMGAFVDKSEWSAYTNAVAQYPTVLWTHTADTIDTHCYKRWAVDGGDSE